MTKQKTNIDLVTALSTKSLEQRQNLDDILHNKKEVQTAHQVAHQVARQTAKATTAEKVLTKKATAKKTLAKKASTKKTLKAKPSMETSTETPSETSMEAANASIVESTSDAELLPSQQASRDLQIHSIMDFPRFNARADYLRKHMKLDKRILNELVKNTLSLNMPIYRIAELVILEFCKQHYPQSHSRLDAILEEFKLENIQKENIQIEQ